MRELNRVAGRADAIVYRALVRNVRVVLLVEFFSIPAALEMDLSAHALGAFGVVHPGFLDNVGTGINAIETDTVGDWATGIIFVAPGHRFVVVASSGFIARQNHEAFWERYRLVDVWATAKVVDHRAIVVHFVERAIRVFVVECG